MIVAIGTGMLFGLAPALSLSRADLVEAFKDDGARSIGSRRSGWLRRFLVVGEDRALHAAAGRRRAAAADVPQPARRRSGVRSPRRADRPHVAAGRALLDARGVNRLLRRGLARIRRIPGVRAAAVVNGVPLERALNLNVDVLDGPEESVEDALTDWRYATPGYFDAMGIPIVAGRGFTEADRAGRAAGRGRQRGVRPAAASRATGRALGRHIRVFDADGAIEIVGVVQGSARRAASVRPSAGDVRAGRRRRTPRRSARRTAISTSAGWSAPTGSVPR